jgi:hypothetical protein
LRRLELKVFRKLLAVLGLLMAAVLAGTQPSSVTAGARGGSPLLRLARSIELDDYFDSLELSGLPFPPRADTLLVLDPLVSRRGALEFFGRGGGQGYSPGRSIELPDTINLTFDVQADGSFRLLLLDPSLREFIRADALTGSAGAAELRRTYANPYDIGDPQGMTIDPASGKIFILDAAAHRIVVIDDEIFDSPIADVSQLDLPPGLTGLRGLAFNPEDGNLHVLNPIARELYELDAAGQLVAQRDVPALGPLDSLGPFDPIAAIFAPSTDLTDEPSRMHLFLAAVGDGSASGSVTEWSFIALAGTLPPATR